MQRFYGEILGLSEIYASDQQVAYDCDGFQLSILAAPDADPGPEAWATQPGWEGDTVPMVSWSVQLGEAEFVRAIHAVRLSTSRTLHDSPQWVGYWSFPVRDPMGNTVEITWPPPKTPRSARWVERSG